jgi:uncharacterized membrane protein YccC
LDRRKREENMEVMAIVLIGVAVAAVIGICAVIVVLGDKWPDVW